GAGMKGGVPSGQQKISKHVDLDQMNRVGEVYAGRANRNLSSIEWYQLLLNRGPVAVPEGTLIKLKADWDAEDISELLKVKADALDVLDLSRARLNSATLAPVSHLTGLKALRLEGSGIDDRALRHLLGLRLLDSLELRNCPITDAGLNTI